MNATATRTRPLTTPTPAATVHGLASLIAVVAMFVLVYPSGWVLGPVLLFGSLSILLSFLGARAGGSFAAAMRFISIAAVAVYLVLAFTFA